MKDILIVDNSLYCFGYQIANGIPILPFYDDEDDEELLDLNNFLVDLKEEKDIVKDVEAHFCYKEFEKFASDQCQLVQKIVENHC